MIPAYFGINLTLLLVDGGETLTLILYKSWGEQ
jgi:hypothetical protein